MSTHIPGASRLHRYIAGYGSLMNRTSRAKTCDLSGGSALAFPVRIEGFRRRWSLRSHTRRYTALGCEMVTRSDPMAQCDSENKLTVATHDETTDFLNAVLCPLEDEHWQEQLARFDERERGYTRVEVPFDQIQVDVEAWKFWMDQSGAHAEPWDATDVKEDRLEESSEGRVRLQVSNRLQALEAGHSVVWLYVSNQHHPPDRDFPLAQTYVDVVLSGCLDFGRRFAHDFIRTTAFEYAADDQTSSTVTRRPFPWVDDREPARRRRYMRAEASSDLDVATIDALLNEHVAHVVRYRRSGDIQNGNGQNGNGHNETVQS